MAGLRSVLLGVVSVLMMAASSSENAAAAEIRVDGPRSCSRATELRTRVERSLGRSLEELGALSCRVHVVRDGGSYAARVELSSAERPRTLQRSFSAKTCPKLMDTLELAVVLAMGAAGDTSVGDTPGEPVSAAVVSEQTEPSDTAWVTDAPPLAKEAPVAKTPVAFTAPASPGTSVERAPAPAGAPGPAPRASLASGSIPNADVMYTEPDSSRTTYPGASRPGRSGRPCAQTSGRAGRSRRHGSPSTPGWGCRCP